MFAVPSGHKLAVDAQPMNEREEKQADLSQIFF